MNMTDNPYLEVNRDHQAALRGIRPTIAMIRSRHKPSAKAFTPDAKLPRRAR
jgi:hypothetical protein